MSRGSPAKFDGDVGWANGYPWGIAKRPKRSSIALRDSKPKPNSSAQGGQKCGKNLNSGKTRIFEKKGRNLASGVRFSESATSVFSPMGYRSKELSKKD